MTSDQQQAVDAHLKSERQWSRRCRLEHAYLQMRRATTDKDRRFWKAVTYQIGAPPRPEWSLRIGYGA